MTRRESPIQRDIELAIGAEPDLLLMRNNVGQAQHADEKTGRVFRVPYGLGVGSADIVGILAPHGRWFCLEVKRTGGKPRPEQLKCHAVWRSFGAFVETVDSVDGARTALARAREEQR